MFLVESSSQGLSQGFVSAQVSCSCANRRRRRRLSSLLKSRRVSQKLISQSS